MLTILTLLALLNGTGAIWMALIEAVPIRWLRRHSRVRKPVAWGLLLVALVLSWAQPGIGAVVTLLLVGLSVVLTYRMHQSVAFPAIDFPALAEAASLPLADTMEIAVIEYGGETRAYALDHLIHHHIINDRFGDRIVSVTYCAMCRSIIPFDVTAIGQLFVASFKQANMVVADRRTQTWFQQATFQSILGPLHPSSLEMVPYQILSWAELKASGEVPLFARFTAKDLRPFELPIPGVWKRIMGSEITPGLSAKRRDKSLPARTPVIGLMEPGLAPLAVERAQVRALGVVDLPQTGVALVSGGGGVNGFRTGGRALVVVSGEIHAADGSARWNLRGKALSDGTEDLPRVAVSDEYWFSWKLFHPTAQLVRPAG